MHWLSELGLKRAALLAGNSIAPKPSRLDIWRKNWLSFSLSNDFVVIRSSFSLERRFSSAGKMLKHLC